MDAPRRFALIPAAGSGMRFGGGLPKQYAPLSGVPLLRRTIDAAPFPRSEARDVSNSVDTPRENCDSLMYPTPFSSMRVST